MNQNLASSAQNVTGKLRGVAFTGLFCLVYAAVYAPKIPTLVFYPQAGVMRFGAPPPGGELGIAMFWFGWVVTALVGAAALAWLMPARWVRHSGWLMLSWLAPFLLSFYVIVHEWHWFTR